jgi:hypothetical protein
VSLLRNPPFKKESKMSLKKHRRQRSQKSKAESIVGNGLIALDKDGNAQKILLDREIYEAVHRMIRKRGDRDARNWYAYRVYLLLRCDIMQWAELGCNIVHGFYTYKETTDVHEWIYYSSKPDPAECSAKLTEWLIDQCGAVHYRRMQQMLADERLTPMTADVITDGRTVQMATAAYQENMDDQQEEKDYAEQLAEAIVDASNQLSTV